MLELILEYLYGIYSLENIPQKKRVITMKCNDSLPLAGLTPVIVGVIPALQEYPQSPVHLKYSTWMYFKQS